MGLYGDQILPRVLNLSCGTATVAPLRRRVCAGLAGDVIEVGFGSGHNVPFYPPAVSRVTAVEPSNLAWNLASDRVSASLVQIERSGLDGQALPYADRSFDTALSTLTLCTIPEADIALRELRRVLKPGGALHFLEHGRAPDASVRRWQHRLDPVEQRLFGGCHFTRPIVDLVTAAGYAVTEVDIFYQPGLPKFAGAFSLGIARRP